MRNELRKMLVQAYRASPAALKSLMSKAFFWLTGKPFVKKPYVLSSQKFPLGNQGGFIVSADFELAWAFRFSRREPHPIEKARQSRRNFPLLLKMFDEFEVPVTWATVGHLFLRSCGKGDHDWMHRIPHFENAFWSYKTGDWFDADPCTSWEKAKEWYAPDLIEMILKSRIRHEVGCHTFSHIDFSDDRCPREVAEDEIKGCVDIAREWGIRLRSFVFPAGTYGNYEILKKYGFSAYRKSFDYELDYPFFDSLGLLAFPSARGFGDNGRGWSARYFFRRFKKYVDKAIATQTLCHFWFHPSVDGWFLDNVLPSILAYAAEKREAGVLWIGTMQELADHITKIE